VYASVKGREEEAYTEGFRLSVAATARILLAVVVVEPC
jgi:hypothetical protein